MKFVTQTLCALALSGLAAGAAAEVVLSGTYSENFEVVGPRPLCR